jgi:DNA-binding response OmpR family regulator
MRILIAEDDATSRIMLKSVLQKFGFEVIEFSDGCRAFENLCLPDSPDIAIIDWVMPGMNGIDIIKKVREIQSERHLYLILLTSKKLREQILEGLESGADDYIVKPYDQEELKARIDVGIRMIKLQNQLLEKKKLQGVIEMAGAVCHEINQPLQVVSGYIEILLEDTDQNSDNYNILVQADKGVKEIGRLTGKIMKITKYKSKDYLNDIKIIDIHEASKK